MKHDFHTGQNILHGDVLLPRLIVRRSALEHNIDRMARYCREHRVSLAPHAKTTMAPGILKRQAAAGAWGFTVATTTQARTLRGLGVRRILIANQVVEPLAIKWLAHELASDDQFEPLALVDSVRGVAILEQALTQTTPPRPLDVLIELGEPGGRAGCRTLEEAEAVARAVAASKHLRLVGFEGFESMLEHIAPADIDRAVRTFLGRLRETTLKCSQQHLFDDAAEVIVTAGGSTHFEAAVEELGDLALDRPVRTVLRPGAYAVYDVRPGYLRPLEIWSVVLSRPEKRLAIAGFGRRDVPSDEIPPIPTLAVTPGTLRTLDGSTSITRLNDQHAFIDLQGPKIDVGELLGCSIPYPTRPAFATWKAVPLVDDDYRIIEALDVVY